MQTRAQRRREVLQEKKATGKSRNKKAALEEKAKTKNQGKSVGKTEGKKKVKKDPSPEPSKQAKANKKGKPKRVTEVEEKSKDQSKPQKKEKSISPKRRPSLRKKPSQSDKSMEIEKQGKKDKSIDKKSKQKKEESKTEEAKDTKDGELEDAKGFKKITFKGKVPVDEYFPHKGQHYQALQFGGKVYSATLNQTSVQNNNNKFYILQVVQDSRNANSCYFYTRWGRVGVPGQTSCTPPLPIVSAISQYNHKYNDKYHKGNYREVELNYENEDDHKAADKEIKKSQDKQDEKKTFEESKLSRPVKRLIELIFDLNMMNRQMIEIGYNVNKMPLGKLSKDNIRLGFNILQKLMDQMKTHNRPRQIDELTNDFYSYIPHDFGFAKMSQFVLNTPQLVKKKIQMLESLSQIKVATTLINSCEEDENKLDSNYKKLNRQIVPVAKDSALFEMIEKYLQTTHAKTHGSYTLELEDLFEMRSEAEEVRFTKDINNKMLLWHGSRLTNYVGILSQGLRIAPPEAPVTGYMFGKGVYFADMSSKSANYCFTNPSNNTGILLLCQVALGDMAQKFHADSYAANLPQGKSSTKGMGRTAPPSANYIKMSDGVVLPMGPGQTTPTLNSSLLYNQYIVYDVAQVKLKYLLRTKFNYQGRNIFAF